MFQNILVVFITLEHTEHTYKAAFELAKKFDSKITFLKCIVEPAPTFGPVALDVCFTIRFSIVIMILL